MSDKKKEGKVIYIAAFLKDRERAARDAEVSKKLEAMKERAYLITKLFTFKDKE